jgi:heat shock protein HslJ
MEKIIGGFAGCNQFFGTISQNKNLIVFSKIGATKIYCSQKDVIAIEREYLTGLSITSKYEEQKNGIIELLDEKNRVILVLEPVNN